MVMLHHHHRWKLLTWDEPRMHAKAFAAVYILVDVPGRACDTKSIQIPLNSIY
jgi:hypothetical protein